jgi:hypothetical protein
MLIKALSLYLGIAQSPAGAVFLVLLSLATCAAIVLWARRGSYQQRLPVLVAACVLTVLVLTIYGVALVAGWWGGAFFLAPIAVQIAVLVPLSLAVWVLWLMGYGWVSTRSRHPLLIYSLVALLLIPLAVVADQANVTGGLVLVAEDGQTWIDALIAVALFLTPVLTFEGIRRGLANDALP